MATTIRRIVLVLIGLIIVGGIWYQVRGAGHKSTAAVKPAAQLTTASVGITAGHRFPSLTLPTTDSKTMSIDAVLGRKPLYVNIWASWCPPCQMETPDIIKAQKKYGDKVDFISINATTQDSVANAEAFMKKYGVDYPAALDKNGEALTKLAIVGLPTSFFVDRTGKITDVVVGYILPQQLETNLQKISG